jgi:2-keto-4-pentenoate hydratase/2-oxohepta-3-ene-1,7-dioic acid hydratase in catechol pathway
MKIIRHLSPTGPAYAALQPDGSARVITGDIYGEYKVADEVIQPGKRLAPIVPTQILCIGLNYRQHAAESNAKVPERPILNYVLGYTCANDVSARDHQIKLGGGQWCRGKFFDTFAPLGPVLVTTDDIPNPNTLKIATILNGKRVQDWTTSDMIFDVPAIISYLSGSTTLVPGTVILTGTPQGVGMAAKPNPVWLKAGDSVSIEIEKIGTLTNPVVDEV